MKLSQQLILPYWMDLSQHLLLFLFPCRVNSMQSVKCFQKEASSFSAHHRVASLLMVMLKRALLLFFYLILIRINSAFDLSSPVRTLPQLLPNKSEKQEPVLFANPHSSLCPED